MEVGYRLWFEIYMQCACRQLTNIKNKKYSYLFTSNADHDSYLCANVLPLKEACVILS